MERSKTWTVFVPLVVVLLVGALGAFVARKRIQQGPHQWRSSPGEMRGSAEQGYLAMTAPTPSPDPPTDPAYLGEIRDLEFTEPQNSESGNEARLQFNYTRPASDWAPSPTIVPLRPGEKIPVGPGTVRIAYLGARTIAEAHLQPALPNNDTRDLALAFFDGNLEPLPESILNKKKGPIPRQHRKATLYSYHRHPHTALSLDLAFDGMGSFLWHPRACYDAETGVQLNAGFSWSGPDSRGATHIEMNCHAIHLPSHHSPGPPVGASFPATYTDTTPRELLESYLAMHPGLRIDVDADAQMIKVYHPALGGGSGIVTFFRLFVP